jgi:hypothetical protein
MERPKTSGPRANDGTETREVGGRRKYTPPKLTPLGSVAELTHGLNHSTPDVAAMGNQHP